MLRWAIWLLLLGNAGYFAWSQGYLDPLGMAPATQRESERMAQQIQPDNLRLLNGPRADANTPPALPEPPAAPAVSEPQPPTFSPPEPTAPPVVPPAAEAVSDTAVRSCWTAGGFTAAQADLLRAELALIGLEPSGFGFNEVRSGGRWIVYLGRYDNQQQLDRKKAELRGLGVDFREITTAGLSPGLALGTYSTEAGAQQALLNAERDGVRTGKVAQERAESVSMNLRLPSITDQQRNRIEGLGEAMAGKRLQRCN